MKQHVLLMKEKAELFKFSVEQEGLHRIQPVQKYIFSGNRSPIFFKEKKKKDVKIFFFVNESPTQKQPPVTDPQPHNGPFKLLLSAFCTWLLCKATGPPLPRSQLSVPRLFISFGAGKTERRITARKEVSAVSRPSPLWFCQAVSPENKHRWSPRRLLGGGARRAPGRLLPV